MIFSSIVYNIVLNEKVWLQPMKDFEGLGISVDDKHVEMRRELELEMVFENITKMLQFHN